MVRFSRIIADSNLRRYAFFRFHAILGADVCSKEVKDVLFLCYPKCTTCQRAKADLDAKGVAYELRDIKLEHPTEAELRQWHSKSGLPLKRFFNTSGQLYRQMELTKKLPSMTEDEQYQLLATDGMLVKRPILISDDFVLVGFHESEWEKKLS